MIVEIKTPSRLHLGLIELGGHMGRVYGGIGVALKKPFLHLKAEDSNTFEVIGKASEDITATVSKVAQTLQIQLKAKVQVLETIPTHRGFGSGTQLSLAVGTALAKINGLNMAPETLATMLGRGKISRVGTAVFMHGGFIVDLPRKPSAGHSSTYLRVDFPEDWAFLVAYPLDSSGPDDDMERQLLSSLPLMDEQRCAKISHIVLAGLLPSLMEHDAEGFGKHLTELQTKVGEHFAAVQGDTFVSREAVETIAGHGALGVGQSSWGPAVYGFYGSFAEASQAVEKIREKLGAQWIVFVTDADNQGARISVAP